MKYSFSWYIVCSAFLLSFAISRQIAAAAEIPSIESLVDGLQRAERDFFESRTLRFRYARTVCHDVAPARNRRRRTEWLLGRDASGWYTEARELDPAQLPDRIIPAEPTVYILKNGTSLDWLQHAEYVYISKESFNVLHGWHYLENSGLNPYRQVIESIGMSYKEATQNDKSMLHQFLRTPLLPDFLAANISKYSVLANPEIIDGDTCWIVEWPGMDKIWVDVDHGCAVRRRVFHWNPGGPRVRQVDNSDFREIKPGLWFSFRQDVGYYATPQLEAEALWDRLTQQCVYEVSELDLSKSPDRLAALRLPVGTAVKDYVHDVEYTVTDDEGDPFKEPLGEAAKLPQRTGSGFWLVIIANGVLAIVAVIWYFVHNRRKGISILLVLAFIPKSSAEAQIEHIAMGIRDERSMVDDKGDWSWKPAWWEKNACGPNALFIMLRLMGKDVTLNQTKALVKCDPVLGCNMADLSNASNALGVSADVLFVRPDELPTIPFPYILHGTSGLKQKTGHFTVIVGRDKVKHQLASIDPVRDTFGWNPESGFISYYSGYILVPRHRSIAWPSFLLIFGLVLLSCVMIGRVQITGIAFYLLTKLRRMHFRRSVERLTR